MNFYEPTQDDLKALCGWAVANGHAQVRDAIEPIIHTAIEKPVVFTTKTEREPAMVAQRSAPTHIPLEVIVAMQSQKGECQHHFSIKTQRCAFCGKSYKEARGKKSELMS